ncbi:hypothetical protein PFICI_03501 [Pestalotiopsis fici W106-1]|uniref:Uncharacterized protein n=1 Tax=Pestalotiopsis fici (strain W106-1 / CGMCC3.15140) TaxID=1229662 RepID=W3XJP2_PESFW|nr:uncharacterized protein PFICI_03501 [Pestalotiopsis fici W106-1]ETS85476.1 hypothetical protein PFICI_03501 [Pestalotiopsis fici W106-1]
MRSFTWAATCLFIARSALAYDPYNITANYVINNKNYYARTWYGDGELYIGSAVPEGVATVTNFTVPAVRADLLYVEATGSDLNLADTTFLVVNNALGASEPVFFADDASGLDDDDLIYWFRYDTLLFPIFNDGTGQSYFYLAATSAPGTYLVKWVQGGIKSPHKPTSAADLDGASVQLTAVAPNV